MRAKRHQAIACAIALALAGWSLHQAPVEAAPPVAKPSPASWPALRDLARDGPRRFETRQRGTFDGRTIAYRSVLAETILADRAGRPASSIFTTSFVATGSNATARRPVMFVFNGGPGGASNALLLGAFGPKRMARFDSAAQADPATPLVDNALAPLDSVDLVFIDPPETGFGRPLPGTDPQTFRSSDGDSYAVGQAILHWLVRNRRLDAPIYIAGESYGTHRAILLARDLLAAQPRIAVAGLLLISQAITYNGPTVVQHLPDPMRPIARLPDVAALAWYHGLIDNRGQTLAQAMERARVFARTDYAAALLQGNRLAAAGRERIADELERIVGLPRSYWLAHDLRIANPRRDLLAARGLALAQFDGRETEPLDKVLPDADRDWNAAFLGLTRNMERFAAADLGAKGLGDYRTIVPDPYGFEKTWTYIVPPQPGLDLLLQEQLRQNPSLRVMVPLGVFDTTSSVGATEALFGQLDVPGAASRIALTYYPGGHMLYSDEAGLEAFAADVRRFTTGGSLPTGTVPSVTPGTRR